MARVCVICNKGTVSGNSISHAHNVTKRKWLPNLQKVRAVIDGTNKHVLVCTRCLRSGKIEKPKVRTWRPETESPATT
jgi:large subunit ribosomal protein L28